jgi:hypothetical protein
LKTQTIRNVLSSINLLYLLWNNPLPPIQLILDDNQQPHTSAGFHFSNGQ